ncbi:hypothetical protein FRB95_000784 [Tulasnella sp. JGI-2019a]|nr:hypothetical protein FRB95_000784 [Tulasnella sp. JGI-2019a]
MSSTALIRPSDAQKSVALQAVHYAKLSTSFASVAASIGFGAAKNGTQLTFSVMRGLTTAAISVTSSYAEQTILGRSLGADRLLNSTVRRTLEFAEHLTLIPLDIAEKLVDTSLVVATCSIDGISFVLGFPKLDERAYQYNLDFHIPVASDDKDGETTDKETAEAIQEFFGPFSATTQAFGHAIPSILKFIRHEWDHPQDPQELPSESYSAMDVIRGVTAYAAIQRVTRVYHERKWFKAMREVREWEWKGNKDPGYRTPKSSEASLPRTPKPRSRRNTIRGKPSSVHVVSDVHLPNHGGEILTAEIGERSLDASLYPMRNSRYSTASFSRASVFSSSFTTESPEGEKPTKAPYPALRHALRRFSRMVLGGYGGLPVMLMGLQVPHNTKAGMIAEKINEGAKSLGLKLSDGPNDSASNSDPSNGGGVPFPSRRYEGDERRTLEHVVDAADQIESDDDSEDGCTSAWDIMEPPSPSNEEFHGNPSVAPQPPTYSWWGMLLGRHDHEVFHAFATSLDNSGVATPHVPTTPLPGEQESNGSPRPKRQTTSHAGEADKLPKFWVLTDHGRQQIVLVLRGTMSLNEVAIDLACDIAPFRPASATRAASAAASTSRPNSPTEDPDSEYHVHAGMYALASAMASPGKPVHSVMAKAMADNENYEVIICGHSLGAGVATIIGLMWADPETCLTVPSAGLPAGRPVAVYCFAPPCVTSPALSRVCNPLVTSFAYSNDMVTRLSKGSVRDLQRAANWLCYEHKRDPDAKESCGSIIRRAFMLEKGYSFMGIGSDPEAEEAWFLALRKTLEVQMRYVDLFPPGRVLWAMRDSSFHPAFRRTPMTTDPNSPRLFEVDKVEDVFGQIVFAPDMVIAHLVHFYDQVLHQFL